MYGIAHEALKDFHEGHPRRFSVPFDGAWASRGDGQRGVTLVEVLVALVVGSVLVAATFSTYRIVLDVSDKSRGASDIHGAGREALRLLERDLRMAGYVNRDNQLFSARAHTIDPAIATVQDQLLDCGNGSYRHDQLTVSYDDLNGARNRGGDLRRRLHYRVECLNGRLVLSQQVEISTGGGYVVGQALTPVIYDVGNLDFWFHFTDGREGANPDAGQVERVEVTLELFGLQLQQARYRSTVRNCNLAGC